MTFWARMFRALSRTDPVSFTVASEMYRTTDEPTEAEPTTEVIQHDQPDWEPPPAARKDEWRPKSRLPYAGYDF